MTREQAAGDLEAVLGVLDGLGVRPAHWRTPWGIEADWTRALAAEHGLDVVGWTADTKDWRGDPAADDARRRPPGPARRRDRARPRRPRAGRAARRLRGDRRARRAARRRRPASAGSSRGRCGDPTRCPATRPARTLDAAIATIAAGAAERDRDPSGAFPADADRHPRRRRRDAGDRRPEPGLLRRGARAAALGRRRRHRGRADPRRPPQRRRAPARARAAGRCATPSSPPSRPAAGAPGSGAPTRSRARASRRASPATRCHGTKTFCSGAGGLERAIVLARADGAGAPVAAWVDLTAAETIAIDRAWFRGAGMRSSASHRVTFAGTPVLAVLGAAGRPRRAAVVRPRRAAHRRDLGRRRRRGGRRRARAARRPARHGGPRGARRGPAAHLAGDDRPLAPTRRRSSTRGPEDPGAVRRPRPDGARRRRARDPRRGRARHRLAPRRRRIGARPRRPRPAAVPAPAPPRADPRAGRSRRPRGAPVSAATFEARYRAEGDPWRTLSDPARAREGGSARWPPAGTGRSRRSSTSAPASASSPPRSRPRCRPLLALDAAPTAVAARAPAARAVAGGARRGRPSCRTTCPAGPFDLVVASEVLYYLAPAAFAATLAWLDARAAPAGRVVAVHWTGSAPDLQRSADDVHAALARRPRLTRIATTRAATYRLDVLAADA